MTRVKICGITNPRDARLAVAAGADAVGLVFAPSPRRVSIAQAQRIIAAVAPLVSVVGVFVNAPRREVSRVLKTCRLDALQFHGEESNLYCAFFRTYCKIIKTCRVRDAASIKAIGRYSAIDAVLLDAFVPGAYGGTGRMFSLGLAAAVRHDKPLMVSGGLTPRNVAFVVRQVHPYAVDVASGVEASPGRKDPRKIKAFIRSVWAADRDKN